MGGVRGHTQGGRNPSHNPKERKARRYARNILRFAALRSLHTNHSNSARNARLADPGTLPPSPNESRKVGLRMPLARGVYEDEIAPPGWRWWTVVLESGKVGIVHLPAELVDPDFERLMCARVEAVAQRKLKIV